MKITVEVVGWVKREVIRQLMEKWWDKGGQYCGCHLILKEEVKKVLIMGYLNVGGLDQTLLLSVWRSESRWDWKGVVIGCQSNLSDSVASGHSGLVDV
jgi:hypothetical protein